MRRYIYRGEDGERIPDDVTHVTVNADVTVVLRMAFCMHPNIVEVICHDKVEKIEQEAFYECPSLRRVIMPGVTIAEDRAFRGCRALTDVECDKLEIIKAQAFFLCGSLWSINLPSARIVEGGSFAICKSLTDAQFGSKLERFDEAAFYSCRFLERITIPLKDGMITADDIFQECCSLMHVHLVEGEMHETVAALHMEEWRNDMNKEIHSINQILPTADAGYCDFDEDEDIHGEKALTIRAWISSLLGKIIDYKAEHQRLLEEDVVPTLQRFVPQDIVMNNVLSFIELPSHSFE